MTDRSLISCTGTATSRALFGGVAVITALALSSAASAGASTCCTGPGPGCDDPTCQAAVCGVDPFCCDVAWDSICVAEAQDLCPELCGFVGTCPASNHDCASTGGPGCTDIECCDIVCALDSFCCQVAWDSICVDEALANCDLVICNTCCPADLDGNGQVDGADLGALLGCWGVVVEGCECADFDGNGVIDGADLGALLGAWGPCPGAVTCVCTDSDHDCCSTGGPGCTDIKCCELVCGLDPFCCDTAWDALCVGEANTNCDPCPTNPACDVADHDCFVSGGPGCTDLTCCNLICLLDAFCCDVAWDGICVSEAFANCELPPCDFACPAGATPEGEPCGDDTNGGCNSAPPIFGSISCGETICGNQWASGGTRDTDWYQVTFATDTQITFSGTAAAGGVIGIVDTGGIPDCGLATALNPFAVVPFCGTASFDACLPAGTYWFFAAPNGFDGLPCDNGNNGYFITLTCNGPCTANSCGNPAGGNDCFTAAGTPFCSDAACCQTVCSIDPFCCQTAWDSICVDEATTLCGGGSNCCIANGGIGCDDPTCQDAVCAIDPFCCATAWDGICAAEAADLCDVCGGSGTGPVNNFCEDRIPISLGVTAFSTIGATTDGPQLPPECSRGFALTLVNDIWYSFVAPTTGTLSISTCNQVDYDSRLAVYDGQECFGPLIGCNDDFAGCGLTSCVQVNVVAGQDIKIRVGGFNGSGSGTLTVEYGTCP